MRLPLALVFLTACGSMTEPGGPGGPSGPVRAESIEPKGGSVAGGTRVTITGSGFHEGIAVEVGPSACTDVAIESGTRLSCTTGSSDFVEDVVDVAVIGDGDRAVLEYAFEYSCPWTTSTGRKSCGAAPPEPVAVQPISAWVIEESQPLSITTDGSGAVQTSTVALPATDMRGAQLKIWLRVQGLEHASAIDLWLGNQNLSSAFKFKLRSGQGQQWITEGDMVAFTLSWSAENLTTAGFPDRAAIEALSVRASDDATGNPVQITVGGVALVPEPTGEYPAGLLSFTFDDNWSMMPGVAATALARHDFPATAYVIIDYIGKQDRATHDQLHDLQLHGWDIAVHSFTGAHHDARFPTLPADVVEDDLVDARAWLMRYGFHGHHHCAYPGGDFTNGGSNVLPIVGRYFTSCRTIFSAQREAMPPSDPLKLRVLYVTSSTSRAQVELAIDRARDNHEWIILVFHKLVSGEPAVSTEWKTSDFGQVVDHAAASGIEVATVSQALAR